MCQCGAPGHSTSKANITLIYFHLLVISSAVWWILMCPSDFAKKIHQFLRRLFCGRVYINQKCQIFSNFSITGTVNVTYI